MAEKPEDFNLPVSVVSRIVKEALPEGVIVSKEARAALSKAASIFVLYATSSANNFATQANRKTLTSQDILSALEELEFDHYVEPLTEALEAYRKEKRNKAAAKKSKPDKSAQNQETPEDEDDDIQVVEDEGDEND